MSVNGKKYHQQAVAVFILLMSFALAFSHKANAANIDSLKQIAQSRPHALTADDFATLAIYELQRDSLFKALAYAREGINKAQDEGNYVALGRLYSYKGYMHISFGTYVKAIDFFTKAEKIGIEHSLPEIVISARHGMGRVYNELGQYDKALNILQKGLEFARKDSVDTPLGAFYNAMGVALQHKGNIKEALQNFHTYYQLSKELNDSNSMIYALVNMGECYRLDSNYTKARDYYVQAMEMNTHVGDAQAEAAIYGNLAAIYESEGDYFKAIQYLKRSINVCKSNNGLSKFLLDDYRSLADDYARLNQYDSSYFVLNQYLAFRDSVNNNDRIRTISSLRMEYELQYHDTQKKILEQKLRNRTLILWFSIALSILIVLLMLITYSRYKLKTRVLKEEAKALNLTIDEKNRELVTHVMDQNRQEELYGDISQALSRLEDNKPEEMKKELQRLKKKLENKDRTAMGWESFRLHFEQVHPDFFGKLLKQNPNLTQNDLRLCAYIKLNLSTKDIANILNVSDRAIQTSRYRIKKKLNLDQKTNLVQFIQGL
jgi:tetratricopeptide (TPR) repeat protein